MPQYIVYPLLLGLNRGRYFLLTGQTLGASQAQELGQVIFSLRSRRDKSVAPDFRGDPHCLTIEVGR
jgi:hypothetical protein